MNGFLRVALMRQLYLPLKFNLMANLLRREMPLLSAGVFSPIFQDYLSGASWLSESISHPATLKGLIDAAHEKPVSAVDRNVLVRTIRDQYEDITTMGGKISEKVHEQLDALLDENSRTITTGQQLHPATGPLYVVFKVLSTINLCRQLNDAQKKFRFVPVFWMASEDHDIEEIRELNIRGNSFRWNTTQQGPTGRMQCEGINEMFEGIRQVLGDRPGIPELLGSIEQAYRPDRSLASATRYLLNDWFGELGLIVLDPDSRELKQHFLPIMLRDAIRQEAPAAAREHEKKMAAHGEVPLTIRPVNLFYLGESSRLRIDSDPHGFRTADDSVRWKTEDLLMELEKFPERFSPNVVLRPLYQQTILPNVAYVGGPSEIVYWLQLKPIFDLHACFYPVLVPRAHGLLIDAGLAHKFEQLGFSGVDWMAPSDQLIERLLTNKGLNDEPFRKSEQEITTTMDALTGFLSDADSTLGDAGRAEKTRILQSLERLEEKWRKSLKRKEDQSVQLIRKIKEKTFPGGNLQERSESILSFIGSGKLLRPMDLLDAMDPLSGSFSVVLL